MQHGTHALGLKSSSAKLILLAIVLTLCAWLMSYSLPAMAQATAAQFTAKGTESCLRCHGGEAMTVMAKTAHGNVDDPHAPYAQHGCESCHGPGSLHVSRARGGTGFPALIRFGDKDTRAQQKTACLDCHAENMGDVAGMEWTGSLHDTPRMTCSTCHELHTTANPLADRETQIDSCATCHEAEITNHNRFESRGILFDQLTCYDCHDVHQLIGKEAE